MAKIAYIFFGQVKNFDEKQYSAFQENVASKLGDFDIDYFLVTSKASFYSNARHAESEPGVSKIDYKSIEKYFDFKEVYYDQDARAGEDVDGLCESVIKFGEAWKEGDSMQSLKNSIKQIYSLEYFYDKFSHKITDYDYFILSRSDLYHTHPLNIDCFSREGDLFAPYYDICPQIDYGWFGGINDRFAVIKNESALKTYCTRYSSIKNNPEYYHAEQYLLKQLKTNNVNYGKIHNFMFLLNRASGKLSDFVGIQPDEKMNTNLKAISKSYFINLDRRTDRLHHMLINTPFFTERFSAIDSKQMQLTDEVKKLFPKTWQKRTKAEICCAISHYRLWQKLIADRDARNYLILEDDTIFKPGFENFWNQVHSNHVPKDAFLIYLGGCQPWNKPEYHKVLQRHNDYFYTVKKNDYFTKDDHFWHMNANSYILSKQGANLLCQWVEQFGMDQALDNFMQNFFNENKFFAAPELVFHLNPLMSYQLHEENDNTEIDKKSDLRFAEEKFQSVDLKNKPIPKKIFQTWENDKLEGVFKYLTDRVKSYNHSYSYEFFDGEKRRNFIKDNFAQDVLECYDLIIPGAFKADLWRYCVLYKYGGIYCDIDMLCFSCFDKVIIGDEIDFFAPIDINPRENICSHAVSNAFIGSSPGHPIIKICIDLIVQNVISERWLNESMIDLDFSGPGLLGRAINLFLGRSEKSKLKGCEGIIEKGLHKIKLIYFKQGLEYMTDLGGDIIFQNKNGNQSIKRLIIQQEKDSNVRPWIEYMIGEKLPYIKKDNANDISLINPTAITYSGKQYTLYRGEKYLDGKPPPLGFNRSDFSYWLEVDGIKKQCTFNFDSYTYKTIRRIDIDLGSNKSIVEDLRFIESSVRETSEGLICLATCCLLPHTRIFQGTKNKDGSWNKSRGLGLEFTFRAAYCQVNLSTAEIKFIDQVDESSQVQNEKNWSCFIHDEEYYVIYSMFPLVYTKARSLSQISFKEKNLNQELIYSSSTNPIKINENQYAMLCHKRNKDKEFCYNYQLVTFGIKDGGICDIQCSPVNVDEGCYCSSITKEGSRIKVFAGVRDLDNKCFYIDIPKMYINQFPNLQPISSNQIPKKIHLSWKNKNVIDSNYELIRKGAKNLELLNPDWDVQVYDDEDVNRLLRDSIGRDNWNLIKDRKITEKTDLWRLLKTYKEGGLYIDIDRYIDTPLSEIIDHKTSCVLPTFQDVDFSQDFILTCAKNPIIGRAIANNLNYRKQGKSLFFLAVYSYMQSVCEVLGEKVVDRGNNPEYFNNIRNKINQCEYLETYREIGPEHHTLFRNIDKQFDPQTFEKDKADFYNGEDVIHWNAQTQAFHNSQKTKKQKLIFTQNNLFEQDFICEMFEGFDVVINKDMNIVEQDSVIVYSDMYAKNINAYPEKFRENLNQLRAKQNQYFEKLKNKNCILVHLSDEHCHAEIDHYKNFKHVFRQYYRKDAVADNVTFIPLGYKKGFKL